MKQQATRQAKLQPKYRAAKELYASGSVVPWLSISGQWLEQAGFEIGDRVTIIVSKDQLLIEKMPYNGDRRD